MDEKKVVIVGGGLSGLSLASELVKEDCNVTVLERNDYLGGRASSVKDPEMEDPVPIAPHIFVTAYTNLRDFFSEIGAEDSIFWDREEFLDIVEDGEHTEIKMPHLSAPFYLPFLFRQYSFLTFWEKLSGFRSSLGLLMASRDDLEKLDDETAYDYLKRKNVAEGLIDKFFRFFSKSLLNTSLEKCSAAEFAVLLKDWMQLENRDFGFAKGGLGEVYTEKAEDYIEDRGGTVVKGCEVEAIEFGEGEVDRLSVDSDEYQGYVEGDVFVSTLTPVQLRKVLPEDKMESEFFGRLKDFEGVPYISVFIWFDGKITDKKFWSLMDRNDADYLNTDFYDKSNIEGFESDKSVVYSNIIDSSRYEDMSDEELVQKTVEEIREAFPDMEAEPEHYHVHRIPYGVYAPKPGMRDKKLPNNTPIDNFYVAGDWTIKEIPQCMEAAVRSGYKCAEEILQEHGIERQIYDGRVR